MQSAAVWGGLSSLLFLTVVWLVGLAGHVVWSGPDLLAAMALALALGSLVGLGVFWQWSLAETCSFTLRRQIADLWSPGEATRRNGEATE